MESYPKRFTLEFEKELIIMDGKPAVSQLVGTFSSAYTGGPWRWPANMSGSFTGVSVKAHSGRESPYGTFTKISGTVTKAFGTYGVLRLFDNGSAIESEFYVWFKEPLQAGGTFELLPCTAVRLHRFFDKGRAGECERKSKRLSADGNAGKDSSGRFVSGMVWVGHWDSVAGAEAAVLLLSRAGTLGKQVERDYLQIQRGNY